MLEDDSSPLPQLSPRTEAIIYSVDIYTPPKRYESIDESSQKSVVTEVFRSDSTSTDESIEKIGTCAIPEFELDLVIPETPLKSPHSEELLPMPELGTPSGDLYDSDGHV
ncbi:hypothetical protein Zmor_020972 [Zophobas morio]|uniref:Uncharacterized protein n=1 Tax=Zophobas morio TaxID=2755281 RepID=A0AA38I5H9_9CUCU|nr:hypothetical protein Zmor_020972 [Zophobas morio]